MMSVTEDKVFEDQIERMKQKNKLILERFQASEEDRKCAETSGSAINKSQNVQIRLRNDDQTRRRKKSNPPVLRPKSFHDGNYDAESGHVAYNNFSESRKQGKFNKTNKIIDDEVAYQDYFHFQQAYCTKPNYGYHNNRSSYHQSNSYSITDDNYNYKPSYRDYQRSTSQKTKTSPRYNSNNFQNVKLPKVSDPSIYKLDNSKINAKESPSKPNNPKKKSKTKPDSVNNQTVDPIGKNNVHIQSKKEILDDEYIDDTLEDLEKYRLKVDMDNFTVTDPECPDPILAMPLTSWTKDSRLTDLPDQDGKEEVSSGNMVDKVNGVTNGDLHSIEKCNIDNLTKMDLTKHNGDSAETLETSVTKDNETITSKEVFANNDKESLPDDKVTDCNGDTPPQTGL